MRLAAIAGLLLLAAAAAGTWLLLDHGDVPVPTAPPQPPPAAAAPATTPPAAATAQAPPPERTQLAGDGADAGQGFTGRVVHADGRPAAGAALYLMPNLGDDPIQLMLLLRTGARLPPLAQAATAADGSFRIGLRELPKACDLCVVGDDFPDFERPRLQPRADDWVELGELRLQPGALVTGRVTDEQTGAPLAAASVHLIVPRNYASLPVPGREDGYATTTQADGSFRLACAPLRGSVTLAAEAPGYARLEQTDVLLQPQAPNHFELRLVRGLAIAGIVQDQAGAPVAHARIVATAISQKLPQAASTQSGSDGTFELPALREGPYKLQVSAAAHGDAEEQPVLAGDREVRVVLKQLNVVRLRVLDHRRQPLRAFLVALKRHFPNSPIGIGNVPDFHDVRIGPSDFDGEFASVRGVPEGSFVLQVSAANHARTLSAPFQLEAGKPPPELTVELTVGGVLRGRVVDDAGRPVAGATVATMLNGTGAFADGGGPLGWLTQMVPDKVTRTSARTDGKGGYRLPLLALGDYELRVRHPDYCEGVALALTIAGEEQQQVPDIVLARGCLVEGSVSVGGEPVAQVRFNLGPPATAAPPAAERTGSQAATFCSTAISDQDGRFRLLKRVPPGTYEISVCRTDGGPFDAFADIRQTARPLQVLPGQDRLVADFTLPPR